MKEKKKPFKVTNSEKRLLEALRFYGIEPEQAFCFLEKTQILEIFNKKERE